MDGLTRHRTADAPPSVVWDVITDHALYADVAPNPATARYSEARVPGTHGGVSTQTATHGPNRARTERLRRTNAWTEPRPIEGSIRSTPITNALPAMVELRPLVGDEGIVCGLGGDADVDS